MKNFVVLIAAAVATIAFYCLHQFVPAGIAGVVFLVALIIAFRANQRVEGQWREKIDETNDALKAGVLETHLLVVQKLFGYPEVAKQAIEKLVEAASYLSGPPPSRMVIDASYIVEWNNRGLALVAEAKAIVDEHKKADSLSEEEMHRFIESTSRLIPRTK
jgi:hypothetical protein